MKKLIMLVAALVMLLGVYGIIGTNDIVVASVNENVMSDTMTGQCDNVTYEYVIMSVNEDGYYGDEIGSDNGLYLNEDDVNVRGISGLSIGDKVRVTYVNGVEDEIGKIEIVE